MPHFESSWLTLEAQSESSDLFVEHGLGSVPGLVEVLVKAVDGPNKDFIFKAIGNLNVLCFIDCIQSNCHTT